MAETTVYIVQNADAYGRFSHEVQMSLVDLTLRRGGMNFEKADSGPDIVLVQKDSALFKSLPTTVLNKARKVVRDYKPLGISWEKHSVSIDAGNSFSVDFLPFDEPWLSLSTTTALTGERALRRIATRYPSSNYRFVATNESGDSVGCERDADRRSLDWWLAEHTTPLAHLCAVADFGSISWEQPADRVWAGWDTAVRDAAVKAWGGGAAQVFLDVASYSERDLRRFIQDFATPAVAACTDEIVEVVAEIGLIEAPMFEAARPGPTLP